ncbi:MAG: peptidyl-prolyl cis-trans isomerase [Polyangiaceae bacterium]|nr:peptidyl-prolyl cis-trans isomerase [Polyangiaceae bacterium]
MRALSWKSGLLAGAVALLFATFPGAAVNAQAPSPRSTEVLARVGSHVITVGDLERRLAGVPPFQLKAFGRNPDEVRKNFLERVLIRESLLSQAAIAEKLDQRADVQDRIRSVLRSIMLGSVRLDVAKGPPITDAEVKAYYDKNWAKFHAPARIAVWRILTATREEAAAVIQELKKDLSAKRWNELSREKSLDKATAMRSGNLGFVTPDGTTSDPSIKVPVEVMNAAMAVKDGELVPEPVAEGSRFAVVWRRQSMKPVERTLEQEAMAIRQILAHERVDGAVKSLLGKLRETHLAEHHPELVDQVEITSSGDLQPVRRPGTLPTSRRPSAAPPAPVPRPDGLR